MTLDVFAYGTLIPGERNHGLVADWVREARPATAPGLRMHDVGTYPIATPDKDYSVHGVVMTFDDADAVHVLLAIDELEGVIGAKLTDSTYIRVRWDVTHDDGTTREVWAYVAGEGRRLRRLPVVAGGDWRERAV